MKKYFSMLLLLILLFICMCSCGKVDYSGDGWYISDGVLYVSKIYYTVLDVAGNNRCEYEEPWGIYKDQITDIVIDGDMVYTEESYLMGETYLNLSTVDNSFLGGGPLFGNMSSLKSVTVKRLNLDRITDISYMFCNNDNLTEIDVSGLDLSGVTDISYLFSGDDSLTNIDMSNVDTSNIITVAGMFRDCTNLNAISVYSWDTHNVKDFSHLFDHCSSLTSIDLRDWIVEDANVAGMFYNCNELRDVLLNVTLENTIAANSMFDENNSIISYEFAENWNIYVQKHKQIWAISDMCYKVNHAYDIVTDVHVEYIYYEKKMPTWYKESVEYTQAVDEYTKLYSSDYLDIYVNKEDGEFSVSDVVAVAIECLKADEVIDSEESALINNVLGKFEILAEWKGGNYSIEDIIDLLEMSEEELQIVTGIQTK